MAVGAYNRQDARPRSRRFLAAQPPCVSYRRRARAIAGLRERNRDPAAVAAEASLREHGTGNLRGLKEEVVLRIAHERHVHCRVPFQVF